MQSYRVLVTGAFGRLGKSVLPELARQSSRLSFCIATLSRRRVTCPGHFPVDITHRDALLARLRQFRPTHVIHLAAVSSPRDAHVQRRLAVATNVTAVEELVSYAAVNRVRLVLASSDFVFRGDLEGHYTEADEPNPQTFYGQTKHEAELLVRRCGGVVARLSMLHEAAGSGCITVSSIIAQGLRTGEIRAAIDEVRTPLRPRDAAKAIVRLAMSDACGIFHVGGPRAISPFELFREEISSNTLPIRVTPINRAALDPPNRPRNVSLDSSKIRALFRGLEGGFGAVGTEAEAKTR